MKRFCGALKFWWLCVLLLCHRVEGDVFLRWCKLADVRYGLKYR